MQKAGFRKSNFKQFEGLDCVSMSITQAFEAHGGNPFEENATELVNILGLVCGEKGVRNLKNFEAVGEIQYTEFYKDVFKKGGGGLSKTINIRKKNKIFAREIRRTMTQDRNI